MIGDSEDCSDDYELVRQFRQGCHVVFSDVRCAHKKVKEINQWLSKHNQFKVLITGKTGTGKTTLVRGLKENYVPDEEHLLPHTKFVTPYEYAHDKIDFTFYDTPGLKDAADGANDYSYLKDMVRNSQEPDLLIFTVKMDDTVFRKEDKDSIKAITDAFGWKVWKHAMFILTFANKVFAPNATVESRQNKIKYNKIRDDFALQVTELLLQYKVQDDIANSIPVVPVGLVVQPIIPSDGRKISWLEEFWSSANEKLKASKLHSEQEADQNKHVNQESSKAHDDSKESPKKAPKPKKSTGWWG